MDGNREYWRRVLENIEFVKAFVEGKDVQASCPEIAGDYISSASYNFASSPETYRIKPQPREYWFLLTQDGDWFGMYKSRLVAETAAKNRRGTEIVRFVESPE